MTDPRLAKVLADPIFKPDRVNELVEMDDQDFLDDTLEDFIDQVNNGLDEMSTFYDSKEWVKLAEKAHFLKGSSLALGCERLGHLFEVMQHLKKPSDADIEFIDTCIETAEKTWEETLPHIDEYISRDPEGEEGDEGDEGEDGDRA
eukprot:comp11692_c0_seq1/m.6235 comp11692_c0_seq1/g.6235  ORF comp11692_c0_seq1/g.6235 comp11692_c0_seq1/m.6235 type:complete len:146 (-) comp11692_c0_seq1:104-541(-)